MTIASTLSNWEVEGLGLQSSHTTTSKKKVRSDHGPSVRKGAHDLCPALFEKWMKRGHTQSTSLPKGRADEVTIASTFLIGR